MSTDTGTAAQTASSDDLPAAPSARSISPAPEEYAQPVRALSLVWPVLWLAATVLLLGAVRGMGWPAFDASHHAVRSQDHN